MKLIVGLGNPGLKHQKTRHNLGFMVIDAFFKNYSSSSAAFTEVKKFKSEVVELSWQPKKGKEEKLILVKPQTYMNGSGAAVYLISKFYKIGSFDIWIINDDVDLPLGAMKIRFGGSSAGHKGVESIIDTLKTDKFWRFRMGIGPDKSRIKNPAGGDARQRRQKSKIKPIDNYVLGEFSEGEKGKSREEIKRGAKALEDALEEGLEKAMNRFNTK